MAQTTKTSAAKAAKNSKAPAEKSAKNSTPAKKKAPTAKVTPVTNKQLADILAETAAQRQAALASLLGAAKGLSDGIEAVGENLKTMEENASTRHEEIIEKQDKISATLSDVRKDISNLDGGDVFTAGTKAAITIISIMVLLVVLFVTAD